jgi:hypothetical protein
MSRFWWAIAVGTILAEATSLPAQARTRTLTLDLMRTVRGDSMELYGSSAPAYLGADGRLIVGDGSGLRVLVIPSEGRPTAVGHPGEGPGEFRHIRNVGPTPGGGFWATDSRLLRMQQFSIDGTLLRTLRYPRQLSIPPSAQFIQYPVAVRSTQRLLTHAAWITGNGGTVTEGHQLGDIALLDVTADGSEPRATLWTSTSTACQQPVSGGRTIPRPFCTETAIATSPDGRVAATATDRSMPGSTGQILVTLYSLDHPGVADSIRLPIDARRRVLAAERDVLRDQATRRFLGMPDLLPAYEEALRAVVYHPSFDRLLVDDNGTTWIGSPTDAGRTWTLVAANGTIRGYLALRDDETPIAARDQTVWLGREDSDGFLNLYQYRWR